MNNDVVFIAFTRQDGGLTIMQFFTLVRRSPSDPGMRREASDENILKEFARSNQQPVSWRRIELKDIPTHRIFREAWVDTGTKVDHHIPKVKNITLERHRRQRNTKLEQLDREWTKATGQNRKQDAVIIEAQRQELRDMPVLIESEISNMSNVEEIVQYCTLKGISLE